MKHLALIFAIALSTATPALGEAGNFALVNGTGSALSELSIRRFGSQQWKSLGAAPAPGAAADIAFSDPDCAFDIRATVAGSGSAVWLGVNLCEAKRVTLNRSSSGELWVDYD